MNKRMLEPYCQKWVMLKNLIEEEYQKHIALERFEFIAYYEEREVPKVIHLYKTEEEFHYADKKEFLVVELTLYVNEAKAIIDKLKGLDIHDEFNERFLKMMKMEIKSNIVWC